MFYDMATSREQEETQEEVKRNKNIICFIDLTEVYRIALTIYMPKALKACFAFHNPQSATKRELKIFNTFKNTFENRIAKLIST